MRTRFTIINSIVGLISKILLLFTSLIVRFFFARFMLTELLGFEGLFSNILGLLSVADLGIASSISYSLYKPIKEKDSELISAYMYFFKRVYIAVGIFIFVSSIVLCPFIGNFVKDSSLDYNTIRIYFLIYSFGVSSSYFFSYNRTIAFAMQRNYLVLLVDTVTKLIVSVLQIIIIIRFKNYLLYLLLSAMGNIVSNFLITIICKKQNLYIANKIMITTEEKDKLLDKSKNIIVTSILGRSITSTDNLLISSLIGVHALALNSNYSTLLIAVQSLITMTFGGATASIGNLMAEGNEIKIKECFMRYSVLYSFVACISSLLFLFLVQPFITLWVGDKYLFSNVIEMILSANLFLYFVQQPLWTFQNMGGLFKEYKVITLVQAILNLLISISLGSLIGISGIFIGTLVSYFVAWIGFFEVIDRNLIKISKIEYWRMQSFFVFIFSISVIFGYLFNDFISGSLIFLMIVNILWIFIAAMITAVVVSIKNPYAMYYVHVLNRIFKK